MAIALQYLRSRRQRLFAAAGVLLLGCAVFVAPAFAWRRPTASERAEIRATARRVAHAGGPVHVSGIRLSTVGPWASATITIYFGNAPDSATDILRKTHGHWTNASNGSAGEWCVMPVKDQRNLGFSASYPCH